MSALGIFLLLSIMIPGVSILEKAEALNGLVSMQKITVSVKNNLDPKGSNLLSQKDMDRIREVFGGSMITHTIQAALPVSSESVSVKARVIGTDSFYSMFHEVRIKNGGFLTQESDDRGEAVAVIEDDLAWQLFNTDNAVGNQIRIFGRTFRIIGIAVKDKSVIGRLSDDGNANIYIPSTIFFNLNKDAGISCFEVETVDDGTLGGNESEIINALQSIGRNPSGYKITDYNIERALMEQKPVIAIFIIGLITIIGAILYIKTIVVHLIAIFKSEAGNDYFFGLVRRNIFLLLQTAGKAGIAILFILGLWQCICFKLYINPVLVPDELIDISYYAGLIKEHFQTIAVNIGYIAPYAEQLFDKARVLSDVLFFAGFLPGLLLLSTGLSLFRKHAMETDRLLLITGILLLVSTGILLLLTILCGLQVRIEMRSFAVLWSFLLAGCLRKRDNLSARTGDDNRISG